MHCGALPLCALGHGLTCKSSAPLFSSESDVNIHVNGRDTYKALQLSSICDWYLSADYPLALTPSRP